MHIHPFAALRPTPAMAPRTAALPYDVVSLAEAREAVGDEPASFLGIDVPQVWFEDGHDPYGDEVYAQAAHRFGAAVANGTYVQEVEPAFYVYRQEADGRTQTGVVGCVAVDDFVAGVVKRHENTRVEKENDRVRHIEALGAQTGPVFLAYRPDAAGAGRLAAAVAEVVAQEPLYDFVDGAGVRNTVWNVTDPRLRGEMADAASEVPAAYIADGHHRSASAVRVAKARREDGTAHRPAIEGDAGADTVMAVLFPADDLHLLAYNRVVADRAGLTVDGLLDAVRDAGFELSPIGAADAADVAAGSFSLCTDGRWWRMTPTEELASEVAGLPAVDALDVAVLQDRVLGPVLAIGDPRTDPRISFVGGNRGVEGLEAEAGTEGVAFFCHPTAMDQVMAVADAGGLMPPKSTWFEPKLRSGLLFHRI